MIKMSGAKSGGINQFKKDGCLGLPKSSQSLKTYEGIGFVSYEIMVAYAETQLYLSDYISFDRQTTAKQST